MCIAANSREKIQQYAREEKKDGWMATRSLHHHQRSLPAVRFVAQQKPEEEVAYEERKESCNGLGSGVEASSSPPSELSLPPRQREVSWQQGNLGTESPSQQIQRLGMQQEEYRGHWQEEDISMAKEEQNTLGLQQHSDHDDEQQ
mmetsp:Transcript_12607/g.19369  ORF Transcript_12607/g.19369 Transcript_12607/m.19369 type:complete len:145 (-) Transcript_12607:137-571(-)